MPPTTTNNQLTSGIRDNHFRGKLGEYLEENIQLGSKLSVVSAYFTIFAYQALKKNLEGIEQMRFLFGDPGFLAAIDPAASDKKAFRIEEDELELSNRLSQKVLARECAAWMSAKTEIRSVRKQNLLHGKMYHIENGPVASAIIGSSNLTLRGMGFANASNIELNLEVDSARDRRDLKAWFDQIWNDSELVHDVKAEVMAQLEMLYADHSPEFIYFKTLFHVFERYLSGEEDTLAKLDETRITEKQIWKALFEFQRDGVKAAIRKIESHNGCILADSVGLGKTYSALAIIKYYELRNQRVLVLCPKKLRENWTIYLANNMTELNPFLEDQFNYLVLSHTDLSRSGGKSGDIDLNLLNWGNFDLVVIDESHNFRNNTKGKRDEDGNTVKKSRYERLMEDIIQKGIKTKVLLLSATPVNNDLKDLRNQLYFITANKDHAFFESFGISSVKETLNGAQRTFMDWAGQSGERSVEDLMLRLNAGFFTLLDELTIARSRRHIKKYYKSSLQEIGNFPKRAKPISVFSEIDLKGRFMSYDRLNDEINNYQLSLYNPSRYLLPEYKAAYDFKGVRNFRQADRERFLIGMMKVNFLKRLESSVKSFAITMNRTVSKIEELENLLHSFQKYKESAPNEIEINKLDAESVGEEDEELAEAFQIGKSLKINIAHLNVKSWLADLSRDKQQLNLLAETAEGVDAKRDAKLDDLKKLILQKAAYPTINSRGNPNRKIVIFAAFADTAEYLYESLNPWVTGELKLHMALVSGGSKENRTTLGKNDFNHILVNFAPLAKHRDKMPHLPQTEEIDLLIATDCISEGQNLQDCDLLVNYDIHWNPVRIIQRFGRIDRIGSINTSIQLVNFWPTQDLNKYINLKNRVEARMALVDIAATAEDNILETDAIEELITQDIKYRDKQLLRLKDEVLDLEDFNESVALNEFSLDDFRLELTNFIDSHRATISAAPLGLYAMVPAKSAAPPGVIYCLRQKNTGENAELVNPLAPYFLVYLLDDGTVRLNFAQAKQVLDLLRALCQGKTEPIAALCAAFDQETGNGKDMARFSALLRKAGDAVIAQFGQRAISGLLNSRQAKLVDVAAQAKSLQDFELITWFIVAKADA
jgi:Helicase conserved C-terminal domain/PLD-like domain/SNF2-related domain